MDILGAVIIAGLAAAWIGDLRYLAAGAVGELVVDRPQADFRGLVLHGQARIRADLGAEGDLLGLIAEPDPACRLG